MFFRQSTRTIAWITATLSPDAGSGSSTMLPVQVVDLDSVVRARGLAGSRLAVPPGRYIVSAVSPDGRQWTASEVVKVAAGEERSVELRPHLDEAPPGNVARGLGAASSGAGGGGVFAAAPRRAPYVVWHGHWLDYWRRLAPGAVAAPIPTSSRALQRQSGPLPLAPFGLEAAAGEDVILEIAEGDKVSYFAVPFDGSRPTTVATVDRAGKPTVHFSFGSSDIDDFLQYVTQGDAESARTISRTIVERAADAVDDDAHSPLQVAVGCYVLLRANELKNLERWTARLLEIAGSMLPDAAVLHVETLARLGRHDEAVKVLSASPHPRMPWFRSGVGYLSQRLELYSKLPKGQSEVALTDAQGALFTDILTGLNRVAWALDPTTSFCAYHRLTSAHANQ